MSKEQIHEEAKRAGEEILERLFKEVGYCGHCGKRECGCRAQHVKLPATIPTSIVIKALEDITGI